MALQHLSTRINLTAMLGAIIGDIVGSRFEFSKQTTSDFELFTPDCNFTDDTICTVAIADAILHNQPYGETLHAWCRRYPTPMGGYGDKFSLWVESENPQPYGSSGNGSAMRVSPIGWLFDDYHDVLREAEKSAVVSHNHPDGINGAQCVATLIYWLRTCRITKDEIESAVRRNFGYHLTSLRDIYKIGSEAHFDGLCNETVPYAISCFMESQSFEDAIRTAVAAGGDTDTKAAICGSIAESYYEIPEEMVEKAYSYLPDEMLDVITLFHEKIQNGL